MIQSLSHLGLVLRTLRRHPLTRDRFWSAVGRYARWQVGSRLVPGPVVVPWVGSCRLLMGAGMWGATMNHYCGLQDFESMAFLLHLLREGDLFLDVGANVGSYSILASGVVGARTIAVEPGLQAGATLQANLQINRLTDRVEIRREAIGAEAGVARFTRGLDTLNHVVAAVEGGEACREVPVTSIDALLQGRVPCLIKLDTEGYETPAVQGAGRTLANPGVLALVVELEGHGARYGFDEAALHGWLADAGLAAHTYHPLARSLVPGPGSGPTRGNVLYLRVDRLDEIRQRVLSAPVCEVLGTRF